MAQTTVTVRMDESLKRDFCAICEELGMNMSTAFTMLAKQMVRERRLPFEACADPFYARSNMDYLTRVIDEIESGRAQLREHELIEG